MNRTEQNEETLQKMKIIYHNKNNKNMILNNTYMYKLVIMKST